MARNCAFWSEPGMIEMLNKSASCQGYPTAGRDFYKVSSTNGTEYDISELSAALHGALDCAYHCFAVMQMACNRNIPDQSRTAHQASEELWLVVGHYFLLLDLEVLLLYWRNDGHLQAEDKKS